MLPIDNKKGFTLLEVMTALSVMMVLLAVAIPRFTMTLEKTRSAEALQRLEALGKSQKAYFYENNAYATSLNSLDVNLRPSAYFNTPIVASSDPIVSIERNNSSYTLRMDPAGAITCVPAGATCGHLGF